MANIFIAFYNCYHGGDDQNHIPAFYESFLNGLKKTGNKLFVYEHKRYGIPDWGKIPEKLLNSIKSFNPDVCILFNNNFYDISSYVDCPIVIYEVDSIKYYSNKEALKRKATRYHYITPQSECVQVISEELGVNKNYISVIPFFSEFKKKKLNQDKPISFIGKLFSGNCYPFHCFMFTNPSPEEIEQARKCIVQLHKTPFISADELKNMFKIKSDTVMKLLTEVDLLPYLSSCDRLHTLESLSDLGLHIYGPTSWITSPVYDDELVFCYHPEPIFSLEQQERIYNSSKLCININHVQAQSGFSWRVCDIMATNGCLVSEYKPDFERLFPGIPIPLWKERSEARELCIKLLKNNSLRQEIVAQCNEVIDKNFRFKHALKKMEDFIGILLHEDAVKNVCEPTIIVETLQGSCIRLVLRNIKRCYKLIYYSFLLLLVQIPFVSSAKGRGKILQKIHKYRG